MPLTAIGPVGQLKSWSKGFCTAGGGSTLQVEGRSRQLTALFVTPAYRTMFRTLIGGGWINSVPAAMMTPFRLVPSPDATGTGKSMIGFILTSRGLS